MIVLLILLGGIEPVRRAAQARGQPTAWAWLVVVVLVALRGLGLLLGPIVVLAQLAALFVVPWLVLRHLRSLPDERRRPRPAGQSVPLWGTPIEA